MTGNPIIPTTPKDVTGVFSLEPPPAGYHWEPAKYLVSLDDFQFSKAAWVDENGVARPGYARALYFQLVKDDGE